MATLPPFPQAPGHQPPAYTHTTRSPPTPYPYMHCNHVCNPHKQPPCATPCVPHERRVVRSERGEARGRCYRHLYSATASCLSFPSSASCFCSSSGASYIATAVVNSLQSALGEAP